MVGPPAKDMVAIQFLEEITIIIYQAIKQPIKALYINMAHHVLVDTEKNGEGGS